MSAEAYAHFFEGLSLAQLAQWTRFNYMPATQLHPSWRSAFIAEEWHDLWDTGSACNALSSEILEKMGLNDAALEDGKSFAMRLALVVPTTHWETLAAEVGATLLSAHVRRALSGQEVAQWRQCLGRKRYDFLCNHAPLLWNEENESAGSPSAARLTPQRFLPAALLQGFKTLAAACDGLPEALGKRLRLRLPADIEEHALDRAATQRIWALAFRVWQWSRSHVSD